MGREDTAPTVGRPRPPKRRDLLALGFAGPSLNSVMQENLETSNNDVVEEEEEEEALVLPSATPPFTLIQ